ncbi:MAG: right-handed parallel beta-helix repeat-containing protein [candidate division Zixibacteria bacterium]
MAERNLVYGNSVPDAGSYIRGVVYVHVDNATVINNTIDNNSRGVLLYPHSNLVFENNIVSNNTLEGGIDLYSSSSGVTIDYNDVWNNGGQDYIRSATPGTHDISVDPIYCDRGNFDYTVSDQSQCLPANNSWGVLIGAFEAGCEGEPQDPQSLIINDFESCIPANGILEIPIYVTVTGPLCAMQIPLVWDGEYTVTGFSYDGTPLEYWDYPVVTVNNENRTILIGGAAGLGAPIPSGENIYIGSISFDVGDLCTHDNNVNITLNTTTIGPASLLFVDCTEPVANEFIPSALIEVITIDGYMAGDANGNCSVNVADAVFLINTVFKQGPMPVPEDAGDANCDGKVNVADIVYLIGFVFRGGDPPSSQCHLASISLGSDVYFGEKSVALTQQYYGDKSVIQIESSIDVYGLQLSVECDPNIQLVNLTRKTQIYYGRTHDISHIGVLDINGIGKIPSGKIQSILEFNGRVEVVTAEASDEYGNNLVVEISKSLSNLLPTSYSLDQNYPNPFNPGTDIRFSLPEAGHVQLSIFNIAGQKIKTLINEYQENGTHTVYWNGKDQSNNNVSSGIYLYKIQVNDFADTKKMILLK